MRRRLPEMTMAFAPQQSTSHPLAIAAFRAWRLREPVSGRRYTVVKLQSQSGETGYVGGGAGQVGGMQAKGGAVSECVLDGAAGLTRGDAATVAKALEKPHLIWFDERTSVLTIDGLGKIIAESVMPIGLGRKVTDIAVFQNRLR